jgi:hypothetical protein
VARAQFKHVGNGVPALFLAMQLSAAMLQAREFLHVSFISFAWSWG